MNDSHTKSSATIADLVDLHEAAQIVGLGERTISDYVSKGIFPSLKLGTHRVFDRRGLQAWIAQREQRRQARRNAMAELRAQAAAPIEIAS